MHRLTMRERAELNSALSNLQTAKELLEEAIGEAVRVIKAIDGVVQTVTAIPLQPTTTPTPEVERVRRHINGPQRRVYTKPRKSSTVVRTFDGPRTGAVAESEFRAIVLEISTALRKNPSLSFSPTEIAELSDIAKRRYPNQKSRVACVGTLCKKMGSKFGIKNVSSTAYAVWQYVG